MSIPFYNRRALGRYRQIAAALVRHGFGWLVIDLGMTDLVPFHKGYFGHSRRDLPYTRPEHVRMLLEDLGPVFIKLGQVLSTRPDMIPPDFVVEFSHLQDKAPPVPFSAIATVVEAELGAPPEVVFAEFDPVPRASASLGQAHTARLHDGTRVIVKVQRPGIDNVIGEDLAVLADLATLAMARTSLGDYYDLTEWVKEFGYTLRDELDYTQEGHNAERIRHDFANEPALYVPRVFWEHSTARVLTMEEVRGVKISDTTGLRAAGLEPHRIAANSVRIMLTEVFNHGFFHADPHPGNFFVLPNETIGLIDFGMVGRLDESLRSSLLRLVLALTRQDSERLVDELLDLGIARKQVQRQTLKRDLDRLTARYFNLPIGQWAAGQLFSDVTAVAFRHRLQLPTDLTLLIRVIAMSEGLGIQLDPSFNLLKFAEPYLKRFWLESRGPSYVAAKITEGITDLAELSLGLPPRLRRLIGQMERGQLTVTTRHEGMDDLVVELDRLVNRLASSVLFAALLIALALLMLIYHPVGWESWGGWFFGLAFLIVLILGMRLLWSIGRLR
jgi:ubiquinone biosynthesis protein